MAVDASNKRMCDDIKGIGRLQVEAVQDDLRSQFNQRLETLKTDCLGAKNKQKQAYASSMLKFPKNIKTMKVSEFNALYKCDLIEIVKRIRSRELSQSRDMGDLETPQPLRRSQRKLQTPSRTVRRGEVMYSENGSPLEQTEEGALVATVTKKPRGNSKIPEAASFDLNVGEGRYISLTDPAGVTNLDPDLKNTALTQLSMLQDQIAGLLKQLET